MSVSSDERGFFPRPLETEVTPCALVDLSVLQKNANSMLDRCHRHGVKLRPNVKTHKCLEIGSLQTDGTKRCISVSTVKEAEYFADGGFDDILLSTVFTEDKMSRLCRLAKRLNKLSLLIDSEYCLKLLERHVALNNNKTWNVYIKVDCGNHRSGVSWDSTDGLHLARLINITSGVVLKGLYVHEGDSYYKRGASEIQNLGDTALGRLHQLATRLKEKEGIVIEELAVGSTPTCSHPSERVVAGLTEFHPGNYVFYDVQQTLLGSCKQEDIAFKVLTRVKGHRPERNELLVDAGFVAMTHDGYGGRDEMGGTLCWVEGHPELRLVKMHQEVGFIDSKNGPIDYSRYPLGSLLVLLPYHSCATACQHSKYIVVEGDQIVDIWTTCRGW